MVAIFLNNPSDVKELLRNRAAYWHQETGFVIIRTPISKDGGIVFQPTTGYDYFLNNLK